MLDLLEATRWILGILKIFAINKSRKNHFLPSAKYFLLYDARGPILFFCLALRGFKLVAFPFICLFRAALICMYRYFFAMFRSQLLVSLQICNLLPHAFYCPFHNLIARRRSSSLGCASGFRHFLLFLVFREFEK